MEFSKKYSSGLRLVAKKMDSLFTVSFGVLLDVGSACEDCKENGYSHFIEHLLFKGTARRTATSISEEMDDIGANLNAFTSKDVTCYYTKSASGDIEQCVDLLSDMYFNASFPEEEIEREKNVVIEEILMGQDMPEDVSQDLIAEAVFYGQKMGRTIVGSVDNIRYSDRHSILKFKSEHYNACNTVISVAGNFDFDCIDKLVEKYFESNFDVKTPCDSKDETLRYTSKFLHRFKDSEQSHLALAAGGCSLSDSNRYALSMAVNILGGGMSSRLFQTIREKNGLAYSVYAYPSFYRNGGYVEVYCGISPDNIEKVCNLLSEEITKFAVKGVLKTELKRACAQAVNGIYMSAESSLTVMRLFGRAMLKSGEVYNIEDNIRRYKEVTLSEVNDQAAKIFEGRLACSYVGKRKKNYAMISDIKVPTK